MVFGGIFILILGYFLSPTFYSKNNIKIETQPHKGCKDCEFRAQNDEPYQSGYNECFEKITKLSREEIDRGTVLDSRRYRKKEELMAVAKTQLNMPTTAE